MSSTAICSSCGKNQSDKINAKCGHATCDECESLLITEEDGDACLACKACSICLDPVSEPTRTLNPGCSHKFCWHCIMEWAKVVNKCPVCRQPFMELKSVDQVFAVDERDLRKRLYQTEMTLEEVARLFDEGNLPSSSDDEDFESTSGSGDSHMSYVDDDESEYVLDGFVCKDNEVEYDEEDDEEESESVPTPPPARSSVRLLTATSIRRDFNPDDYEGEAEEDTDESDVPIVRTKSKAVAKPKRITKAAAKPSPPTKATAKPARTTRAAAKPSPPTNAVARPIRTTRAAAKAAVKPSPTQRSTKRVVISDDEDDELPIKSCRENLVYCSRSPSPVPMRVDSSTEEYEELRKSPPPRNGFNKRRR